jgi:hypothetical protein
MKTNCESKWALIKFSYLPLATLETACQRSRQKKAENVQIVSAFSFCSLSWCFRRFLALALEKFGDERLIEGVDCWSAEWAR